MKNIIIFCVMSCLFFQCNESAVEQVEIEAPSFVTSPEFKTLAAAKIALLTDVPKQAPGFESEFKLDRDDIATLEKEMNDLKDRVEKQGISVSEDLTKRNKLEQEVLSPRSMELRRYVDSKYPESRKLLKEFHEANLAFRRAFPEVESSALTGALDAETNDIITSLRSERNNLN